MGRPKYAVLMPRDLGSMQSIFFERVVMVKVMGCSLCFLVVFNVLNEIDYSEQPSKAFKENKYLCFQGCLF